MKNAMIFPRISASLWLLCLLILVPDLCFASQRPEADTVYVLTITHFKLNKEGNDWIKTGKISYISANATVDLTLADGRVISQAQVTEVGKDYITLNEEIIPLPSIQEITVGKTAARAASGFFGLIFVLLGVLAGIWWIALFFFAFGGTDLSDAPVTFFGILSIPLAILALGIKLIQKFPARIDMNKPRFSLGTTPISGLSEKNRKKLSRKFYLRKRRNS